MNQVSDILTLVQQAKEQNVDAVLATVVRTEGSAYRHAGAMMLICADGRSVGMISGGCLEPHIIKRAFWLTRDGASVQTYQTGDEQTGLENDESSNDDEIDNIDSDDELNFGLGCNGRVHVLFERLSSAKHFLALINQVRMKQKPTTIATLIRTGQNNSPKPQLPIGTRINIDSYQNTDQTIALNSEQNVSDFSATILDNINDAVKKLAAHKLAKRNTDYVIIKNSPKSSGEEICVEDSTRQPINSEWLIQRIEPQNRLLICGAGNDVMPLVTMAKLQDWHVTVIDSRAQYATRTRFAQADSVRCLPLEDTKILIELSANAAVALMSHSLSQDRARLAALLAKNNFKYLGQLGPRYRTERLIAEISASNSNPASLADGIARLHYPIGLKLGGDGPESLALSIIAQISAVINGQAQPKHSKFNLQTLTESEHSDSGMSDYAHE